MAAAAIMSSLSVACGLAAGAALAASTHHATTARFAPTVSAAMRYIAPRAKVPLMAPTEPGFSPFVRYMGAQAQTYAHGDSYSVNLLATEKPLPVNSPALSAVADQAMNIIGSFGGVEYASAAGAKRQLYRSPAESLAPAYLPPPKLPAAPVALGHGIEGTQYRSAEPTAGAPMVLWHEGDWTFEVWDGTAAENVQQAKAIVAYLHTHLLPETYGVLGVNIAGDGSHSTAEWVYGDMLYSCFAYESGLQAAEMAVSARLYPGGQIRP